VTTWPSTTSEARDALWRVHVALVEIRAAAWAGDPGALRALDGLSDALNDLVSKDASAFEARLRAEVLFRRVAEAVPPGPSVVAAPEAVAFARAVAWVTRNLRAQLTDLRDLAKAADELEYLPCEFLRLGAPAITSLADPAEPLHVRGVAEQYALNLSP
jgi:hypothetical protein